MSATLYGGASTLGRKASGKGREPEGSGDREGRRSRKQVVDRETITTAIAALRERITRLKAIDAKMDSLDLGSIEVEGGAWLGDAINLVDRWRNRVWFQLEEEESLRGGRF